MTASISVCVPAYNAARTLDATMRSILDQDVDLDVLVLDNATEDGTADIAHSFDDARVRVARNDAVLSIGDNWNKAVSLCAGELVKIVCADDVLRPGSIEAQAKVMADPTISLTSARFDVIDEAGDIRESGLGIPGLEGLHTPRALIGTIVRRGPADFGPTAAAMFRREHFDGVGGFRGDLVFPMDVDLFARVSTFGMFFGMSERVAAWRDSTFNLCSRTSSFSKLTDMMRFHHRIAKDYPDLVSRGDVIAGDTRLARAAFERLSARSRGLAATLRR
ncbi:glycosyltransferase [Rhodococcus aetherivorans]|uniref:glycosyltransferase family 2 protein n=1 Tax=Rhodococcus TaxID=1827 RepID=UPI0002D2252E|nr:MULTISPECIES: glycosyltransferase [Rhodococcus]PND52102.1 glycosyl transferase [Rhodococcus sp. ENV425]WKX00169.1 glycosyltransferase [Rhodococcus aetherivorans]CCW13190.1 glycosyl transferase, family 2 [Rhodococcus aetherivorans]